MVWIGVNDKEEDYDFAGICVPELQLEAAYATDLPNHLCKLNVASRASIVRLSGIACMIGIATREIDVIEEMIENGMNIAVLNLPRGSYDYHYEVLQNIREANKNYSDKMRMTCPLAIGMVTKGPAVCIGFPLGGDTIEMTLYEGDTITLTADDEYIVKEDPPNTIYINYSNLYSKVKIGSEIYIDGRRIKLICIGVENTFIFCTVVEGGNVRNHHRVYLPGIPIDLPALSERDKLNIRFAVENRFDIIFAAYVREKAHVHEICEALGNEGRHIKIISQIENQQGMENLDEILEVSDGVMVARKSLTYEMDEEEVFLAQKSIISRCNVLGKPAICTVELPLSPLAEPSLVYAAEGCDIANCILDGADCIFLDRDTRLGYNPIQCLQTAAKICKQAEVAVWQTRLILDLSHKATPPTLNAFALARSTVEISMKMLASAIIVVSTSLKSAQLVVQYRPKCPVIVVTRQGKNARTAHLFRGLLPLVYKAEKAANWETDIVNRVYYGINFGRKTGFIRRGDPVVVLRRYDQGSGFADSMRVMYTTKRISHGSECIC